MVLRKVVVAAVLVDSLAAPKMLLAGRRSAPEELVGQWEFPGGKLEPGEDPVAGLRRELREELGIEVTVGEALCGPRDGGWDITDRHRMYLWFAQLSAGVPQPLADHDELRWLSPPDFLSVPWLTGDLPIVDALIRDPRFYK